MRGRLLPLSIACLLLGTAVLPIRAQEAPSATMAETVAWISEQVFRLNHTYPEAPSVLFDPITNTPEAYCAGSRGSASALGVEGCFTTCSICHGDYRCSVQYVQGPMAFSGISDCSGSIVMTVEQSFHEDVVTYTDPIHRGPDMYCIESRSDSGTARVRMRVSIPLSEFSRATNQPASGAPNERFWLQTRDARDVIHITTDVTASYFHGGGHRAFDVHTVELWANSPSMAQRLANAFQHLADLCASTRPVEPF